MKLLRSFLAVLGTAAALNLAAADRTLTAFAKKQLEPHYWSEGAAFGDLNRDGKPDAIFGPYWWEGPDFKVRHELYPATRTTKTKKDGKDVEFPGFEGAMGSKNSYSTDNFFTFVYDFDGDGWNDVLTFGLPGTPAFLYLNPRGKDTHWARHQVFDEVDNESPTFADIDGDGKPELLCNYKGNFGYAKPDWKNVTAKWGFTPVSEKGNWGKFTHGLGVGDVNGDGRADLIFAGGWFEQPASLAGNPVWKLHKTLFAPSSSQMYAYDVNGDGLPDIVTALASHGYGLAWYEQLKERDANGEIQFKAHVFMNKEPRENRYGVAFSQLHALELVDVDGDGLKDIVTGKCFWAHGPGADPEPNAPPVLYWYKLVRHVDKSVDWVPQLIDNDSGVGRQIGVADVNGDGRPDLLIGNKKGAFVFLNEAKKVSAEEWDKAQPKVLFADAEKAAANPADVVVRTGAPATAGGTIPPGTPDAQPNPPLSAKGVLPVGADGKPLNTDFETGDLRDWTATGDAWKGQPVKGPINQRRQYGAGKLANHAGNFWLGGFEVSKDGPTGTLTSAAFKVTQPWAAFLLGGGSHAETRVELVAKDGGKVFFTAHGRNDETMLPVVVDLAAQRDKEIFIRIVDEHTGGWGHVNFDDFKLYAEKPAFAPVAASAAPAGAKAIPLPVDDVKFAGLTPDEAVKAMILPPGFKATLFAGEPDVKQPIAFCQDDRGRLWVVECYTYPQRKPGDKGDDRILVFEDTNGDGKFDKRTVFLEGLNLASGIEWGFGGVYVGAVPWLLHIPVKETENGPQPAGEPVKLLEGFAWQDTHEMLNTFTWGPDGRLYGCHGVFTHSHVKVVGAPDTERQFINAGVWRYHPTKKRFEVFAEGTSNPWGVDFNEHGQCFIEACVIPHLFHMIQGGRYQRQGGQHYAPTLEDEKRLAPEYFAQDFSRPGKQPIHPFIYDDLKTIADHRHFVGGGPHAGNGRSDAAGGGHAHAGLMCYLGGSWPKEYHGKLIIGNIHGQRLNVDVPERAGSGYVGKHAPDFVNFNDRWSQTLNQQYDQDGSVYVIDWYDKQQCHSGNVAAHDRSNGRIYKITYGDTKTTTVDFAKLGDNELVNELRSLNDWRARHAQRILQERAATLKSAGAPQQVRDFLNLGGAFNYLTRTDGQGRPLEKYYESESAQLRLLWTLHSMAGVKPEDALQILSHAASTKQDYLRAWTIQLLCEDHQPGDAALKEFARLAKEDPSPVVRLYLASACQRLTVAQRQPIVEALLAHAEDATDQNLPLMYWFATEPIVAAAPAKGALLLAKSKIPLLREYITRRMTAK